MVLLLLLCTCHIRGEIAMPLTVSTDVALLCCGTGGRRLDVVLLLGRHCDVLSAHVVPRRTARISRD